MATVMPVATFPKTYVVNEKEYTVRNATEDVSFQAKPVYSTGITVKAYPKTLVLGQHEIVVKSAAEETSARAKFGQG